MFDYSSKPGYPGRDAMRERAEALFRSEGRTNMRSTPNLSARDRIPPRTFAKGGHAMHRAEGGKTIHRLTKEQSDMHMPRRISASKYAEGGSAQALRLGGMAHGGKARHHSHRSKHRYDEGGIAEMAPAGYGSADSSVATMRLGGMACGGKTKHHKKHRAEGGELRRAKGGSIYEREMLGEHPSRRAPHINYESNMRGEHMKHHRRYAEGGEARREELKCGGRPRRRAEGGKMAEGGSYAMGGVGKIRHEQATRKGLPINRRFRGH